MTTEYRKKLNRSVMVTTLERPELNYELEMLKNNRIPGLLPFEMASENGKWQVVHDITGHISLDDWMETERMDATLLRELMARVSELCEAFEPYLLDENKLCLLPDHIFLKNGSRELGFTFLPEESGPVASSFRELLEYILSKIDHHEEELVQLAYGAYEKTGMEGYSIADLLKEPGDSSGGGKQETLTRPGRNRTAPSYRRTEAQGIRETEMPVRLRRQEPEEEEPELLYEEDWEEPEERGPVEKKKSFLSGLFGSRRKKEKQTMIYEEEEEEDYAPPAQEIYEEETTYLNPNEPYCKGVLRYMGSGEEKDIRIQDSPFFVGTRVGVGGKLHSGAVSRLHAKITQAGEVYLIEDLNSTNGTFVNDRELSYKSPVTLHPKDLVRFADEEFTFI